MLFHVLITETQNINRENNTVPLIYWMLLGDFRQAQDIYMYFHLFYLSKYLISNGEILKLSKGYMSTLQQIVII